MRGEQRLLALGAALFVFLGGCGDDPETIVELTVIETIPVDFDDMQGGVAEGATVNLDDLREEPAYVESVASLRCASVDRAASFIEIEALQVAAGATVMSYQVGVAPRGGGQFTPLASFNGSVTPGEKVALSDARVAVDAAGLQLVSQVVLSGEPALSVEVTASVPGGVDDLLVALSLAIDFSSRATGCP
jgi:hypothetical protein